ncbi:MAG: DUF302 domain-containing protein [Pseudomonadota bacterium]
MKIFPARLASLATLLLLLGGSLAAAQTTDANGIIRVESPHPVAITADRYEAAAREKGIRVFSRFDHAQAAREYDEELPPTVVIAVGNPRYGTKFMRENQIAGIDFPPKAVVYEDPEGQVWLAYNSAEYLYETIFARHGLDYPADDVAFYSAVLEELAATATAP